MKSIITPREKEVLHLIANEFTTREMASKLFVSTHTIISHRKHLLSKLDVKNVAGLVRKGFEEGILILNINIGSGINYNQV